MNNFKQNLQIITLYLHILSYVLRVQAEGISCFKCFVSFTKQEEMDLLCSHFDGSEKFQVFCPSSTLCMKRTIEYKYNKTTVVTSVQRDCAPQKYISHTYNDIERKWHKKEEVITSAYDEGCFVGEHRGAPTNPPEYCFCSFHLCNSSTLPIRMLNEIYGILLILFIRLL
ncbi:uncharacterized protein LOC109859417 [Pseudomyrmex gracilis]|uniref:uncharacterized protein LOC109859417 n=1 Tax=Pseudomyrmex gracilis TaxID=219809 RepID=UPI0009958B16|nr:uncharacterized protein LOC109859417 [Pseudomyrmex gracilis]